METVFKQWCAKAVSYLSHNPETDNGADHCLCIFIWLLDTQIHDYSTSEYNKALAGFETGWRGGFMGYFRESNG